MKRLAETIREHDFELVACGYQHVTTCRLCARWPALALREPLFIADDLGAEEVILCHECGGPYVVCAGCPDGA